jgi:hypothetical protein
VPANATTLGHTTPTTTPATSGAVDTAQVTLIWWAITATILLIACATCLGLLIARRRPTPTPDPQAEDTPRAQRVMYFVALLAMGVSADTSWRFVGGVLGITGWEQIVMFAIIEVAMIACGVVLRSNLRRGQPAGQARTFLWLLAAAAAMAAWQLSGFWAGIARVVLGPLIGIWALHIALGIDMRAAARPHTGTWQRLTTELREWALSWIGLGDTSRDAIALREERAARAAAAHALALRADTLSKRARARKQAKLVKQIGVANVAHNPRRRELLLAELAALSTVDELVGLDHRAPWAAASATATPAAARRATRPATALPVSLVAPAAITAPTSTAPTTARDTTPADTTTDTAAATSPDDTATPAQTTDIPTDTTGPADTNTSALSKVDQMRALFDAHVAAGTLGQLSGADLARAAGAATSFGRRKLQDWTQELPTTTTTTT